MKIRTSQIDAASLAEFIRDTISAALIASGGLTITVDDAGDSITLSVPAAYTDEQVRDVIGTALVAGAGITLTVNDAGDTIAVAASGAAAATGELLMQDGVSAPPVPIENEARTDWLYLG